METANKVVEIDSLKEARNLSNTGAGRDLAVVPEQEGTPVPVEEINAVATQLPNRWGLSLQKALLVSLVAILPFAALTVGTELGASNSTAELRQENQALSAQVDKQNAALSSLQVTQGKDVEKLQASLTDAQKQVTQLQASITTLEKEKMALQGTLTKKGEYSDLLMTKLKNRNNEIKALKVSEAQYKAYAKGIEAQLVLIQSNFELYKSEVTKNNTEIAPLNGTKN